MAATGIVVPCALSSRPAPIPEIAIPPIASHGTRARKSVGRSIRSDERDGSIESTGRGVRSTLVAMTSSSSRRNDTLTSEWRCGRRRMTWPAISFSPPVIAESGLFSTKKKVWAIATVIMAK